MKIDIEKSKNIWYSWRERIEKEKGYDPIQSLCNWEWVHPYGNFKLECWNVAGNGSVIFQFWPKGNGFTEYITGNCDDKLPID